MSEYLDFLASKTPKAVDRGIAPSAMPSHLFPYQRDCIAHNLRVGAAGLFLDTGLGKTACELEWCRQAAESGNGKALILTPLAVAHQIAREGKKWGYDARVIREQDEARAGINICNYDRLEHLDPTAFDAVALDESSILKSFTGKTTRALIAMFGSHRFKLSATATPAPNDHMELGQHVEFCSIMTSQEMLTRYFINDTSTASQNWRLKGHSITDFWDWMASWCRMGSLPSDLSPDYDDSGFVLPPFEIFRHRIEAGNIKGDGLFASIEMSATKMHEVKRQTADVRARLVADLVTSEKSEPWVIWCDTDYEADAIHDVLDDVTEVRGSMTADKKEAGLSAFADGSARVLLTKPSVAGFGLNWQHCARTVFVGRTFSYEMWYQAVRRFWRFGQKRNVHVHLAVAEGEDHIGRVIDRKSDDHSSMKNAMREAMRRANGKTTSMKIPYHPTYQGRLPAWLKSVA